MRTNQWILAALVMLACATFALASSFPSLPQAGDFKTPDNDSIRFSVTAGTPGHISICLTTAKHITWWKGLKIFGSHPQLSIGLLATTDNDHGPACRSIPTDDFVSSSSVIEFWKAKMFGVHTYIGGYSLDPKKYDGKKLNFAWQTD